MTQTPDYPGSTSRQANYLGLVTGLSRFAAAVFCLCLTAQAQTIRAGDTADWYLSADRLHVPADEALGAALMRPQAQANETIPQPAADGPYQTQDRTVPVPAILTAAGGTLVLTLAGLMISANRGKRARGANEEVLASAFQDASVGLALITPTGHLLDANREFCRTFGVRREDALSGKTRLSDIIGPGQPTSAAIEVPAGSFPDAVSAGTWEASCAHPDGRLVCARLSLQPLGGGGSIARWLVSAIDVTERKRTDSDLAAEQTRLESRLKEQAAESRNLAAQLAAAEDRFRLFLDHSPTIAWIRDDQGQLIYANKAFGQRFGVALETPDHPPEIRPVPAEFERFARRADLAMLDAEQTAVLAEQSTRPDGTPSHWVNSRFTFRDVGGRRYVAGVGLDISENKRIEAALRESEQRFRSMADCAPVLIWMSGLDKGCNFFNETWLQFTGRSLVQEYGYGWAEGVHPDDLSRCVDIYNDSFDAQEAFEMEYRLRRYDGEYRWLLDKGRPRYDHESNFVGYIGSCTDITEHVRMRERLEAASEAKSGFLATMSHEIRTPLTAITGYTQMLRSTELSEQQRRYVLNIVNASEGLLRLINDSLDLSKIEAGELRLESTEFSLAQVVENVRVVLGGTASEKGINLAFQEVGQIPPVLVGDPLRLTQVLINLAGNAVKFSEQGTVAVAFRSQPTTGKRVALQVLVRDEGIGMTPEQVAALFAPFAQAELSTTRRFGGTGLGLTISQRLVGLMGGEIRVESECGQGSTFQFTIPLGAVQWEDLGSSGPEPAKDDTVEWRADGAEILLVDDVAINRNMLKDYLESCGFRVRTAENGRQAIEAVKARRPAAVLMDCQMPVMDGFDATRIIRSDESYRTLPIIALSAHVLVSDRKKCREAGMDTHLAKPVNLDELVTVLANLIEQKHTNDKQPPALTLAPNVSVSHDAPGFDTQIGLKRVGGNWQRYVRALRQFHQDYVQGFGESFDAAMSSQDWVSVKRLAHSLKGVSGMLGATTLATLSDRLLVTASENPIPDALNAHADAVSTELSRLGTLLSWLNEEAPSDASR